MLQAESTHLLWSGADEANTLYRALLGEFSLLAEEAISGMNGLCTSPIGDFQDLVCAQITFRGNAAADAICFIRFDHVPGQRIGVGKDRHAFHVHAAQRADNTAGDGAAIGY